MAGLERVGGRHRARCWRRPEDKKTRPLPENYPDRTSVADEKLDWRVLWSKSKGGGTPQPYQPPFYTDPTVLSEHDNAKGHQQKVDPPEENHDGQPSLAGNAFKDVRNRQSFAGTLLFDANGFPLNPRGRTGLAGRGVLYRWGANRAIDPIVTRYKPDGTRTLQVLVRKRHEVQGLDNEVWALPGEMERDADEDQIRYGVTKRLRELLNHCVEEMPEEATKAETADASDAQELWNKADDRHREKVVKDRAERHRLQDRLFSTGQGYTLRSTYVDDPRNTDNAWLETKATHFHCDDKLAELFTVPSDETTIAEQVEKYKWLDVDLQNREYENLYGSHRELVEAARKRLLDLSDHKSNVSEEAARIGPEADRIVADGELAAGSPTRQERTFSTMATKPAVGGLPASALSTIDERE